MKTPKNTPTTRASLIATAAHNTRWFAGIVAGTTVLGSTALAVDNNWTAGAGTSDWNTNANWSDLHGFGSPHVPQQGGAHPGDEDAIINTIVPFFPVLLGSPSVNPRDFKIGNAGGTTGRLDVRAGTAATGGGSWIVVGDNGGNGTLNVADTSAAGGTFSGFAQGTGVLTVGGRLYVGGEGGGGGVGTLNMNTTMLSTVAIGNDLSIGDGGGTGTFNLDSGKITTGGWNFCGRGGGQGFLNVSGGSITNSGRFYIGENGTGTVVQTGGSVLNGDEVRIGEGDPGVATYTISGGTFTANNWFIIGRNGSDGTLNLSGSGIITKGGGDPFALGNDAPNGSGTFNQSGGTITTASGSPMHIGNVGGGSPGVWAMSGGIATIGGQVRVGAAGIGTLTMTGGTINAPGNVIVAADGGSTGTLTLSAGTLTTGKISGGGGTDTTTFNGTQIVVSTPVNPFFENLDGPTIGSNGLKVDTAGFNATSTQVFAGGGGVIKTGSGTLTLLGASTNTGTNTVSAGKLFTNTSATGSGNFTVANNAGMGVVQTVQDEALSVTNVTFGTSNSLDINLGNFVGNTTNAPLNVTGTLTLAGNVTINIADQLPDIGIIPLVSYSGAKVGTGVFVQGTLPNGVQTSPVSPNSIIDNPNFYGPGLGLVYINVTSVALPFWDATFDDQWDTDPNPLQRNWINLIGGVSAPYVDGNPVLFDDFVSGPTQGAVVLNQTVLPSGVTFNNSIPYSLSGTGKISGSTGLLKQNTGTLALNTGGNDYTGVTTLEGGITSASVLADGGSASSIGKSAAVPASLVLSGGTLNYTGASTTINRGFTVAAANSGISTQNALTLTGTIATTGGNLTKSGPGNLTLSTAATNIIGLPGQINQVTNGTLTLNGGTTSMPGELWIASTPNVPAQLVLNSGILNVGSWIALGRGNGDTGTLSSITATNSTITSVNFSTGFDNGLPNDSDQTITLTNTNWTNNGRTALSESPNSTTNMTIGGTSAFVSSDRFNIAFAAGSVANVVIKDSGSLNKIGGWLSIGNSSNGIGTMTVQDFGTVTAGGDFNVADVDTSQGTITVKNSAVVNSTGTFFLGKNANTIGTANLDGGTTNVVRVRGGGGTGNLNFNGGVLRAGPGADGNFIDQVTNISVLALGGTIDSNGQNISTGQTFADGGGGGGITKTGAGILTYNGVGNYTGATTVSLGTLAGTASLTGPLVVSSGATLAPGNAIGTISAGNTTISAGGTVTVELNGANSDLLSVNGALNLSALTDTLNIATPGAGATLPVYVIANYTTLAGTFNSVTGTLPGTYSVDYNYLGNNEIALVRPPTPFELWIDTFYPGETDPAIIGSAADPDSDGQSNGTEFALGGKPNSGSDNARVYKIIADSSDPGSLDELLLTIAVLNGTPAFAPASGNPAATQSGYTYTIQGGTDLTFTGTASVVAPITTGLPAAPAGYTYRTFSLNGSNGTPGKGFLRVNITP